ncbi:tyrosine--tRNA ligase [Firmicutes bacterium CAG:449]|nr:tyrosine--tRNA ligase [Firmicutes bacterium CAG:449]
MGFNELPSSDGQEEELLLDALIRCKLATSKREAREFVSGGAITVNGEKVTDLEFKLTSKIAIDNRFIVLRRGKKKYGLVRF